MFTTRREFLRALSAAAAGPLIAKPAFSAANPTLGLIFRRRTIRSRPRIPEGAATRDILVKLSTDAYAASKKADAVVVSCGALKTIDVIVPVEDVVKVPVVSSTPHGLC